MEIQVNNISSKITGVPSNYLNMLSSRLTVKVPNFYFSPAYKAGRWDGTERFLKRPENTFPTGLLPIVLECVDDWELPIEIRDLREQKLHLPILQPGYQVSEDKTLRDYQLETFNILSTHKVHNIPFYRGVINIATNGGKTVIAESIISELYTQLRSQKSIFLFVTHSKEIAYQVQRSLESDLSIPVGFIGDGKWEVSTITIAIIPTVYRRMKDKKSEFAELRDNVVGVIVDESHHASSTSFFDVLQNLPNAYIRVGLTGTVDKKNPVNEMRLYSCTGTIINKISNAYLIKKGVSAKPICMMFKVSQPELDEFEYADAYNLGIVNNDFRQEIIRDICEKETNSGNTVLVLVERIEHGNNIEEVLKPLNKEVYFTNGELSSDEREDLLNRLKNNELDVLIASNILDEGVDVSGINALIYARGMKSIRKLLQGIGRGLRLKSDNSQLRFYDFIDDTHKQLLLHSKERYETLAKEKFYVKLMSPETYNTSTWEEIMK